MEYKTRDYAKPTLRTSQIGPDGETIVYRGMRSAMTKFKKYMFIVDILHNGIEKDMLFNSVKLSKIFSEHNDDLMGASLKIVPEGIGPQREYTVIVLPTVTQEKL